jgi:predicted metallopeptidase
MKYVLAPDLQEKMIEICLLIFPNVNLERIKCFRSYGTNSKRVIARCHSMGKIVQLALEIEPFYVLEFISERFDKMNYEEKLKVIIHELMHIPKKFSGGFVQHHIVNHSNVEVLFKEYLRRKNEKLENYLK